MDANRPLRPQADGPGPADHREHDPSTVAPHPATPRDMPTRTDMPLAARIRQGRLDLAAALRWAARCGLNEGVCNHFSLEVGPDRYLINPQGLHWSEVQARDILLIDGAGKVLDGHHGLEPTAFFIHSWIHRENPRARCILHTHMPYATAITLVEGGRLEMAGQNALRYFDRIAYDDVYNGLALDADEGRRIASQLGENRSVMFMASHGVTVVGPNVAWAFDDLYYLERACMHQVLAVQAAGGRPLRKVDDALAARVAEQVDGERQQSELYFESIKRMLDREDPEWSQL